MSAAYQRHLDEWQIREFTLSPVDQIRARRMSDEAVERLIRKRAVEQGFEWGQTLGPVQGRKSVLCTARRVS